MAVNPETKLSDLRAALKEKETEVGKLVKDKESLRTEVAGLEKVVREINQVATGYSTGVQNVETNIQEIEEYFQTQLPEIEAAAGEKKDAAIKKIGVWDSRIKKMKKERQTLDDKVKKTQTDYEAAKQDFLEKQKAFHSLKGLRKSIEDKLDDIKTLRASAAKEEIKEEEADNAILYFLIRELEQQLAAVKSEIKPAEEFKTLLIKTWQDMDSAGTAVKKKEEQAREAKEKYETNKKELESMRQNRRKIILTELTNI